MIPSNSTPIKNEILTEIFAKGKLSYTEMRITAYIIRNSWGYSFNGTRQQWTRQLSVTKIAKETEMDRAVCSRAINRMIEEKKLLRNGDQYQFNEHLDSWVLQKVTGVAKSHTVANCHGSVANCHGSVANCNTQPLTNRDGNKASSNPKETLKEKIKDKRERENIKEKEISSKSKITYNRILFKFENIPGEKLQKWKEAYRPLNVEVELKKMEAWCAANPEKRKKNWERFIINWLSSTKGERYEKSNRFYGITTEVSEEGKKRLKGITSAGPGEW